MDISRKGLGLVTPITPDVNEGVVNALRAALREAKEGKIQAVGLAIAVRDPDGDGGRSTETVLIACEGWYHSLSCAVNGLAFRLNYERYTQGSRTPYPDLKDGDE